MSYYSQSKKESHKKTKKRNKKKGFVEKVSNNSNLNFLQKFVKCMLVGCLYKILLNVCLVHVPQVCYEVLVQEEN